MAYDVTALPAYVEQNRLPLLAASVLKGKTIEVINRQSGVKGKAALNIVNTSVRIDDGSACGFNDQGSDEFTQRVIETFLLKVEKEWCWKDLIGKWTEYQYRIIAGDKTLAFEEFFLNDVANKIAAQIESILWNGDGIRAHANSKGFLGELATTNNAYKFTATGDYAKIMEAYMQIPEAVLDRAVIFCSANRFRGFVTGLVAANLYHYDPAAPTDEIIIPGTNTRLIKVNGLNNSSYTDANSTTVTDVVVACDPMNLVYGYDIDDSDKNFDVWYSRDNDTIRLRATFNIGTQVAFPSEVIVAGD